jgi:hypothetical protein
MADITRPADSFTLIRMVIHRALAPVAIAASLLLAACSSPSPSDPAGGDDPAPPSPTSDAPLDYPFYFDEGVRDAVAGVQADVATWHEGFAELNCTAEEAIDETSGCPESLVDGFHLANQLKTTVFDVEESDFETSSGMANFEPVWVAALATSESGGEWSGSCQYGPTNDGCGAKAAVLIADLTEYAGAFATWRP